MHDLKLHRKRAVRGGATEATAVGHVGHKAKEFAIQSLTSQALGRVNEEEFVPARTDDEEFANCKCLVQTMVNEGEKLAAMLNLLGWQLISLVFLIPLHPTKSPLDSEVLVDVEMYVSCLSVDFGHGLSLIAGTLIFRAKGFSLF